MWLNWTRFVVAALVGLASIGAVAADGAAGEKYKPVFEVKLTPDSGEIVALSSGVSLTHTGGRDTAVGGLP